MNEYLALLVENIVPIAALIIGTLLIKWIRPLLSQQNNKLSAQTNVIINQLLMDVVAAGVAYTEQWAKKLAKDGKNPSSEDKMYEAMQYIFKQIERYGFSPKNIPEDEIKRRIETILGFDTMAREPIPVGGPFPDEDMDFEDSYPNEED